MTRALHLGNESVSKFHELRAAKSLALQPIYAWLTEGFGALDLREAEALLQDLADEQAAHI